MKGASKKLARTVYERLDYDAVTGLLYWRVNHGSRARAGALAGSRNSGPYIYVGIDKRRFAAHQLVWFFEYGKFPGREIDHINRDTFDNRIINLRLASKTQNQYNRGPQKNNTSGYKGVCWVQARGWRANIKAKKRVHFLGYFDSAQEANAAYVTAAKFHQKEFAKLD